MDYGTVEGFRSYHTARGRDTAAYDDETVEAAKLIASEWLDARYLGQFTGYKVEQRDQVREWPRTGVQDRAGYAVSPDTVPNEIVNATYEATLKELESSGSLNVDYTPSKYRRVSIDGAISVDFASTSAFDLQKQFPIIDQILAPLLAHNAVSSLSGYVRRA